MIKRNQMKKVIFLLIVIFTVLQSSAQTSYVSTYNQTGEYSTIFEKWNWSDLNRSVIPIKITKSFIEFENQAKSKFTIIEDKGEDVGQNSAGLRYKGHNWIAIDHKYRKCYVLMTHYFDDDYDNVLTIMYEDLAFRYYIPKKRNGIDSFNNDK